MSIKQDAIATLGLPFKWDAIKDELIAFDNPNTAPLVEIIDNVILEYAEKVMWQQLRSERNQLLTQTDWRMTSDYPGTNQAEWQTYRQALRDLPENCTPALDKNGNLINVNWPTPPTE